MQLKRLFIHFQLQQYKSNGLADGDKPKENGSIPSGSPETNGEQQPTQVKVLFIVYVQKDLGNVQPD